ncbi:MAG: hypothetical protein KGI38_00125 [Thaumarchaeota archaeon]|nr:hypothetical protein [Nitrososphaerota archaeon]
MGWGLRLVAAFVMLVAFSFDSWPIALLAFLYLVFSLRRPRRQQVYVMRQGDVFTEPGRPWKRYAAGGFFLFLSLVSLESGGTYSPVVFFLCGIALFFWPRIRRSGFANRVVPVKNSVLLRSLLVPFLWHALIEVKLESQDQTRGIASMSGKVILFAGKAPSVCQVVSVYALDYAQAERRIMRRLKQESRMLSQRGAHLLPMDSVEAAGKLSMELERLELGTDDLEAVSSLPFDVLTLRVQDGLVVSHRAFNVSESQSGGPAIPAPDVTHVKQPLFAEMVQEIGEKHGWPSPDEFSPFLAALDASRNEPFADRVQMKGETGARLRVETPSGTQVGLTRPQLRALARIYG